MSVTEKAVVAALRPSLKVLAELADLRRAAGSERGTRVEAVPSWPEPGDDPSAMNRYLRHVWTRVQLDSDMSPAVVWRDTSRR
jgi:hypothetical protein